MGTAMYELLNHPVIGVIFIGALGACVGSFLNVVILRLPVMMRRDWEAQCAAYIAEERGVDVGADYDDEGSVFNLNTPRSHCPVCKAPLKAWHNIPVISWILLSGRCSNCRTPISWRYPLVELITAIASAYLAMRFGVGWPLVAALAYTWSLISLTVIDIDHQLLPDNITLPLLWGGLLANLFGLFAPLESAVVGAIVGYASFWTIFQVHRKLTGREGMGYGDFKLLAAIGAWTGWELLPVTILIASISGTLAAVALMFLQRFDLRAPISFGPFLAVAGWVALVFGTQITTTVLPLFQF